MSCGPCGASRPLLPLFAGFLLGALAASSVWLARGSADPILTVSRPEPAVARALDLAEKEQERRVPDPAAVHRAKTYARGRAGLVSFAVVDSEGKLHGRLLSRRFPSASVVKAMLLAAALRSMERTGQPLDATISQTLRAMITYSDNATADSIYAIVGDSGLLQVADAAGLRHFSVEGYWANARITAADMARFFSRLGQRMPGPHREFALGLLGSVVPEQSWGIPRAAGKDWAVRFKGGWRTTERGWVVHQAAELRDDDLHLALAVLTDGQPSQRYGTATVRGISERLLVSDP